MTYINFDKKIKSSGSYFELTGNDDIQHFITTLHSETIKSGNTIEIRLTNSYTGELPIFLGEEIISMDKIFNKIKENPKGFIIFKGFISYGKNEKKIEIDCLIFKDNTIHCFELKKGDNFDTKKSKSEFDNLELMKKIFNENGFEIKIGFVCMNNTNNKHSIKDNRADKYFINGIDFCNKFDFNYNHYNQQTTNNQKINEHLCFIEMEKMLKKYKEKNNYATTM